MFPVRYGRRNFFNLVSTCCVRGLLVGIWLVDALQSLFGVCLSPVVTVFTVFTLFTLCGGVGCGVVWCGWGKPSAY